ncbi:hypothetical protein [uncultured Weissella sp.]|jgi:hypothetical protein|uniref:hypothetical protein n=1 Tax=uncultured Weissella sp. TaxID=253243 RepID=UPI0027DCFEF2|nr:hypothetical protein [uncultured Weissella sp.]
MKRNQIYRVSEFELNQRLDELWNGVKVIEFYGKDIPDLDTFLKQCIQKFKLPVITPEEDEDEQFPDYNIPDPLHGLSYAMMDLSNISDYPQQPIMMVIHDEMKFLYAADYNDSGIVWNMFISSLFPYYDMDQEIRKKVAQRPSNKIKRKFDLYLVD